MIAERLYKSRISRASKSSLLAKGRSLIGSLRLSTRLGSSKSPLDSAGFMVWRQSQINHMTRAWWSSKYCGLHPPTRSVGAEDVRRLEIRLPDVQAAMTVLGRRAALPSDPPLNLQNVDLHGANLKRARLSGALFNEANLDDVDFQYAQLENTHFAEAKLRGARFDYAQAKA